MPLSPEVAINQNRKSNQPISSANVLDLESNHRIKSQHPLGAFDPICAICKGTSGDVGVCTIPPIEPLLFVCFMNYKSCIRPQR